MDSAAYRQGVVGSRRSPPILVDKFFKRIPLGTIFLNLFLVDQPENVSKGALDTSMLKIKQGTSRQKKHVFKRTFQEVLKNVGLAEFFG